MYAKKEHIYKEKQSRKYNEPERDWEKGKIQHKWTEPGALHSILGDIALQFAQTANAISMKTSTIHSSHCTRLLAIPLYPAI